MAARSSRKVRYSISEQDLRERGVYLEKERSLPLPNAADLMGYVLKAMVLWLLYLAGSSIYSVAVENVTTDAEISAAVAKRPPARLEPAPSATPGTAPARRQQKGTSSAERRTDARAMLERLNDSIDEAANGFADTIREVIGEPVAP